MLLIGLDAATKPDMFGFALGRVHDGAVTIDCAGVLKSQRYADALAEQVLPALREAQHALIAIDAPLGWPETLPTALGSHKAGELISAYPEKLFRRATDRQIKSWIWARRPR